MTLFEKNVIPLSYKSYLRVLLPQTAEIRTIPKSLPRSFQNNFKCLFFKRLYQIDEILKYIIGEIIENDNGYGCQYLTVDALNNSDTNKFYSKFGFQNVTNEDHCAPFRRMYYPLIDLF